VFPETNKKKEPQGRDSCSSRRFLRASNAIDDAMFAVSSIEEFNPLEIFMRYPVEPTVDIIILT
jgi:hypothetical protein